MQLFSLLEGNYGHSSAMLKVLAVRQSRTLLSKWSHLPGSKQLHLKLPSPLILLNPEFRINSDFLPKHQCPPGFRRNKDKQMQHSPYPIDEAVSRAPNTAPVPHRMCFSDLINILALGQQGTSNAQQLQPEGQVPKPPSELASPRLSWQTSSIHQGEQPGSLPIFFTARNHPQSSRMPKEFGCLGTSREPSRVFRWILGAFYTIPTARSGRNVLRGGRTGHCWGNTCCSTPVLPNPPTHTLPTPSAARETRCALCRSSSISLLWRGLLQPTWLRSSPKTSLGYTEARANPKPSTQS